MSRIEFVSIESFPEDEYTKELAYLCIDSKFRIAYVRKKSNNGGLFWAVANIGVKKNGMKEYFPAFIQDSNFLERDIRDFLEQRRWECAKPQAFQIEKPTSMSEVQEEMPF